MRATVLGWADRTFQKSGFLDEPGLRNPSVVLVTVASVRGAGSVLGAGDRTQAAYLD